MIHTTPDETFDIIMKIHVRAPFRLIRQAAPYFRLKVSPVISDTLIIETNYL
jgi:NAD(P)-dependent dehydrogenase (short-subunit alcohol dehydrogenase family)